MVLTSDPYSPKWNTENYIFHKQPKWNYMDCCMMRALLMYAENNPEYLAYAERFIGSYVCADGSIPTLRTEDYNLDSICGGNVLLRLYQLTGKEMYANAARMLYEEQLRHQPRLSCGNFWHKAIYRGRYGSTERTWLCPSLQLMENLQATAHAPRTRSLRCAISAISCAIKRLVFTTTATVKAGICAGLTTKQVSRRNSGSARMAGSAPDLLTCMKSPATANAGKCSGSFSIHSKPA